MMSSDDQELFWLAVFPAGTVLMVCVLAGFF
jgi:hypothetical protein